MKKPVNVPFSETEYEKICRISTRKGLKKSTIVSMFLKDGFPDFEEQNQYGIFVKFEETEEFSSQKLIQILMEKELFERLTEYRQKTKIAVPFLVRQIVIPQITKEREP